jgi:aspartyl-tRNA(Asn)/glutamyl-tRNA(Gln) amidotransferase subunit A
MSLFSFCSIAEIRGAFVDGKSTAREITESVIADIAARDGELGAFLEVFVTRALAQADKLDADRAAGKELGPLAGVPIAIKDNMLYAGEHASSASKILENYISPYTATAVQRLIDAGAIIIGRTNMDEFAMGSSTETSAFQLTRNPWNTKKIPGGSSGGSTVAVAAGFVPVALGSDTGGSIRQPASVCGVVGYKPSYGRVSRYGLMSLASSLDQIGPLARNVEDARLVYGIIQGEDAHDQTTLKSKSLPENEKRLKNIRIGVISEQAYDKGIPSGISQNLQDALLVLRDLGAEIIDISLPLQKMSLPAYYIIQPAEASSNLGRYDGLRYGTRHDGDLTTAYTQARTSGFGTEAQRRILLGTFVLSAGYADAFYKKALAVRSALRKEFAEAFKQVDVIVGPTSPFVAWNIGEKMEDPLAMYLADVFTVSANICGLPAISVPCGMSEKLPVGLHIQGAPLHDDTVLAVAQAFQNATEWHRARP